METSDKSFRAFVSGAENLREYDAEFVARLARAAGSIDSLNALTRWAKERWPDDYGVQEWRKPSTTPHGSTAMKRLWAAYLEWREATR